MDAYDYEITLEDRLSVIRQLVAKEGEDKFYLSFSGGKDSTILHHLLDEAIPGNSIPRVFIDTGIEYAEIRAFVMGLRDKDTRFQVIRPSLPIKKVLETYGYPFKSKQHSHNLMVYQHSGMGRTVERYLGTIESNTKFRCPKVLRYQFEPTFQIKVSDQCCLRLKKMPVHKWEKENARPIAMTGMRRSEGGEKEHLSKVASSRTRVGTSGVSTRCSWSRTSGRIGTYVSAIYPCAVCITLRTTSSGRGARDARSRWGCRINS